MRVYVTRTKGDNNMYGMSPEEQKEYEDETILNLKRIENELIEHSLDYIVHNDHIECDGEILKPMSITALKEFLGY